MPRRPSDDLYVRYMRAYQASARHTADCTACQTDELCAAGAPLHERFARLQDAYRTRQAQRNR
ncbi:hypothetical protein IF129_25205 [Streptomyces chumphonensis]|uniref:Uncharacterized protein n=1 Tax=Streptomyces chumphonensis TaxID=1214925 RepID=A0A927IF44_9ACTN|nr:hypothetical protein [Streptomyces chumphonensis]MBD3934847.1 hypothetical protein [Streptomyces chumphonensis]